MQYKKHPKSWTLQVFNSAEQLLSLPSLTLDLTMQNCTLGNAFPLCIVSVARRFLPGWVTSPPQNPPHLPWLGSGTDPARRFYMQKSYPFNRWLETLIKQVDN